MMRIGVLLLSICLAGVSGPSMAANRSGDAKARRVQVAAATLPADIAQLTPGPETTVPFGWVDFCRRYAGECESAAPVLPADFPLTTAAWKQIQTINKTVNAQVEPVSDMDHWGVVDQWDYPTDGRGDCEDYALLKRKLLIGAGIPRQDLLMTVVRDTHDDGHAVLMLRTDRGDFVLDNMSDEVKAWNATGYRYVKRQSQVDQNSWLTLRGADVPVVAAVTK